MSSIEPYRKKYAFAEDYGTSQYKFGPLAEKPDVIENRGFVISEDTIIYKIVGITTVSYTHLTLPTILLV